MHWTNGREGQMNDYSVFGCQNHFFCVSSPCETCCWKRWDRSICRLPKNSSCVDDVQEPCDYTVKRPTGCSDCKWYAWAESTQVSEGGMGQVGTAAYLLNWEVIGRLTSCLRYGKERSPRFLVWNQVKKSNLGGFKDGKKIENFRKPYVEALVFEFGLAAHVRFEDPTSVLYQAYKYIINISSQPKSKPYFFNQSTSIGRIQHMFPSVRID